MGYNWVFDRVFPSQPAKSDYTKSRLFLSFFYSGLVSVPGQSGPRLTS